VPFERGGGRGTHSRAGGAPRSGGGVPRGGDHKDGDIIVKPCVEGKNTIRGLFLKGVNLSKKPLGKASNATRIACAAKEEIDEADDGIHKGEEKKASGKFKTGLVKALGGGSSLEKEKE